jgi:hypothetical protein
MEVELMENTRGLVLAIRAEGLAERMALQKFIAQGRPEIHVSKDQLANWDYFYLGQFGDKATESQ